MHLRGHHPDNLCVCVCVHPERCGSGSQQSAVGAGSLQKQAQQTPHHPPPPPPLPKMNKLRDDEASSTNPKHQMENQMGWRPGNDNERLKGFQ